MSLKLSDTILSYSIADFVLTYKAAALANCKKIGAPFWEICQVVADPGQSAAWPASVRLGSPFLLAAAVQGGLRGGAAGTMARSAPVPPWLPPVFFHKKLGNISYKSNNKTGAAPFLVDFENRECYNKLNKYTIYCILSIVIYKKGGET